MKQYLPGRLEIVLFASLALIGALIAGWVQSHDAAIPLIAFPLFMFCSILGVVRSGRLRAGDDE